MTEEEWLFSRFRGIIDDATKLVRRDYEKKLSRLRKENKKLRAENKDLQRDVLLAVGRER